MSIRATATEPVDMVVIGGGIVGLAVAFEAGRVGRRVIVLERDWPGAGATGVAAGMLALSTETAEVGDRHFTELAIESCRLYPEFVRALEAESGQHARYRTEGSLLVALHHDHEGELERTVALQRALGLRAEQLGREEVLAREPRLSPRVTSGLLMVNDYQVDPRSLTAALVAGIQKRGGSVLSGACVTSVATDACGMIEVHYACKGEETAMRSEIIVVAAGAWTNEVLAPEWGKLPLRPVKGQVLRLRGEPLLRHVVRTPDVYLVPREDGELVVGATTEEQGFDRRAMAGSTLDLLLAAWRTLPGVYDLELTEASVGFRPALRDHLPAIGPTTTAGVFVATGHYRHGILLAPVTARLLVEVIDTGRIPALLDPFRPTRPGLLLSRESTL